MRASKLNAKPRSRSSFELILAEALCPSLATRIGPTPGMT